MCVYYHKCFLRRSQLATWAWALLAFWVRQFAGLHLWRPSAKCREVIRHCANETKSLHTFADNPGDGKIPWEQLVNIVVITGQHMCLYFPLSFRRSSWREFKTSLIIIPSHHHWGNGGITHVIVLQKACLVSGSFVTTDMVKEIFGTNNGYDQRAICNFYWWMLCTRS